MTKYKVEAHHLQDYLVECLQIAVDNAAKDARLYLTQYIMDHWYSKYSPKVYKRTFDFVGSASKTDTTVSGRNGTSVICMLFFDTKKIRSVYYGPEYLNPHASFEGRSTAEYIPTWIENGAWFYGRGKTEGLGSMEATINYLEKNFPNMVKKELQKMGLNVKVSG